MSVTFQSSTLQALYDGTAGGSVASAALLSVFRTGGDLDLDNEIASFDARVASFESVLLGEIPGGKTSTDYPYDRKGLKREFLDEVVALLMRSYTITENDTGPARSVTGTYAAAGILAIADKGETKLGGVVVGFPMRSNFRGDSHVVVVKDPTITGNGNFDNLNTDVVDIATDPRLALLNADGQAIFKSYATLVDAVFDEGEKLGSNPAQPVQLATAIQPITVDGVTYNRTAQVSGVKEIIAADGTKKKVPTYDTYLLETAAESSHVTKNGNGGADLTGPASSTAHRLLLTPEDAAWDSATSEYTVLVDGLNFRISPTKTDVFVRTSTSETAVPAEVTSPLLLNVPDRGAEFPDLRIVANYRYTASNGRTYLIGLSNESPDGKIYVTSLDNSATSARVKPVGTTASVSGLEYMLYYNEARIKILRAQLAYKEAVVREIQDDLRKANEVLAELEKQNGAVTATNTDGTETGEISTETLRMNLFNATNSAAGKPFFDLAGSDSYHTSEEWTANRVNLKNYIDRRSAEAQEATLDYQTVLNRFNNGFEVMAKLQEKLDTLLKAQLRNLA